MFSDTPEVLHWLDGLRARRQRLNPALDNPEILEIITDAVRHAGTLRFDGAPIDRALIAEHSGLTAAVVDTLLDEIE